MKRLYYILASLLVVAGCAKDLPEPVVEPVLDQNIKVPVSFNLLLPSDGLSTRAMANEPEIDHICVAVFGASGFFNEWIVASIDNVEEVNYDGTPETKYNIRISLTMSDSRLRLHFIANGPVEAPLTGQPAKDNEDGMMGRLTSQLASEHNDGYWQKVVLPIGVHAQTWLNTDNDPPTIEYWKDPVTGQYVPTVETIDQFPDPIKLVRNFARIRVKLAEGSDLTAISRIALAYVPIEGSFAPMMEEAVNTDEHGAYSEAETEYLDLFVPGYSDISDVTAAPYNYKGYFPPTIQLGGYGDDKTRPYPNNDDEMTAWAADKYLFVYERTVPTSSHPATRLVVKATHRTDGEKYYRIDLHDAGTSYPLLRNHTYIVSIGNVAAGTGRDNPKDAAESPSTSDISAEVTDLPEVSDGIAEIAVQFIENTYVVGSETHTLDFRFVPLVSNETPDNTKVRIELGTGVGNSFVKNGTSGNGPAISGTPTISNTDQDWGRITFTLTENDKNKFQTIRVIGTKNDGTEIYRDVVIYLKMKQLMTVECIDKYVLEESGERELVRVYIPGDLSKSMFPMEFKVEPTSGALNPDGENMPVGSGKSLSGNGATVFYFIKTLTWEDYQGLSSLPGDSRKYFECNFKTTKDQNAGEVWVSNSYFLNGADETATNPGSGNKDEYFNYTKRYFYDLVFSGRVEEDQDVDFSFKMDRDHTGADRVLPDHVTVTLSGLVPKSGYTGLTPVDGEDDVYIYEPGNNPIATLQLTAIDEVYSITLTTDHNSNPLLYEEASRTKADPCPYVSGISLDDVTVAVGEEKPLSVIWGSGSEVTDQIPVTWSIDNPAVARISPDGVVTGQSAGTATITVSAGGKSASATVTVRQLVKKEMTYDLALNNQNGYNNTSFSDANGASVVFTNSSGYRTNNYWGYTYHGRYVGGTNNGNNSRGSVTIYAPTEEEYIDAVVTSITVTYYQGSSTVSFAPASSGTSSATNWEGSAESVTITMNGGNNRRVVSNISVTYEYWE